MSDSPTQSRVVSRPQDANSGVADRAPGTRRGDIFVAQQPAPRAKRKPNRNFLVLGFDFLMLLAVVATCNVHFWGLAAHEVLGLAISAVFCVHIMLSRKQIAVMIRKLARPNPPQGAPSTVGGPTLDLPRRKAATRRWDFRIDAALAFSFAATVVSGIASSRVLFGWGGDSIWLEVHQAGAGLSLALTGVHLGRNWNWVKAVAVKLRRQAAPAAFWLAVSVASLAILVFGGVGMPVYTVAFAAATVSVRRIRQQRAVRSQEMAPGGA
ncbi:MAG: DUF4405 domain-containing protein [Propionibacteriaceae bacterium]|nr:DUF4405 domain-containing protein [Propionibacteriaceae bacterium]